MPRLPRSPRFPRFPRRGASRRFRGSPAVPAVPPLPRSRRGRLRRLAVGGALAGTAAATALRWFPRLDAVEVAGDSMTPLLQPGDFVLLVRGAPRVDRPQRFAGAVVAAVPPTADPDAQHSAGALPPLILKRVVALPGEAVRAAERVQINGRELWEPYAHGTPPPGHERGVAALGPTEYFLMGDHRSRSTDSRDFGPVRAEAITGRAVLRYWPPARWGRVPRAPRRFHPASPTPTPPAGTFAD